MEELNKKRKKIIIKSGRVMLKKEELFGEVDDSNESSTEVEN